MHICVFYNLNKIKHSSKIVKNVSDWLTCVKYHHKIDYEVKRVKPKIYFCYATKKIEFIIVKSREKTRKEVKKQTEVHLLNLHNETWK